MRYPPLTLHSPYPSPQPTVTHFPPSPSPLAQVFSNKDKNYCFIGKHRSSTEQPRLLGHVHECSCVARDLHTPRLERLPSPPAPPASSITPARTADSPVRPLPASRTSHCLPGPH